MSTFEKITDVCTAVRRWLEARRVGIPTTVELGEATALAKERDAAKLLFATGQLNAAVAAYERVVAEAERRDLKTDLHAGRLGLALSLLALDRLDEARAIARTLEFRHVAPPGYLTAVRVLTALELTDESAPFVAALSDDAEFQAFNAMLANTVPGAIPQTPDLVMQGAAILTNEHRFATAAHWLQKCFETVRDGMLLSVFYLERVAALLEEWCWNVPGDDPVSAAAISRILKDAFALSESIDRSALPDNIAIRLTRAELGIATRTYDEPRVAELSAKLEALAGPPPDEPFVVALRTALSGDVDKAMSLLAGGQPEWRARMQRLSVGFVAGQASQSIEALSALALEYPDVPIIQGELTRRLVELSREHDALPSARRSYQLLPGVGQAIFLAHTLIASGSSEKAEAFLRTVDSSDPRIAGLLAQSIENRNVLEAVDLWTAYLEAYPLDWGSQLRVINLMARANRFDSARDRAWSLIEKHPLAAPPQLFFEAAVLQDAFGAEPQRTDRIKSLWESLDKRAATDPAVDRVRLLIWLHLNANVPLPKPEFERLPEGAGVEVESSEMADLVERSLQQAKLVRHLYDRGHVSILSAFPTITEDPAAYVFSLGRGSYLPAGEAAPKDRPPLTTTECVRLGVLEILALVRLDLLPDLEAKLEAGLCVHVFEDVIDALSRILLTRSLHHSDSRREDAKRLLVAATSGAFTESQGREDVYWIDSGPERIALLRDVKDRGAISSRTYGRLREELVRGEGVEARPLGEGPIGVTLGTLRWLLDNQLTDAASPPDRRLCVLPDDIAALKATIANADEEAQVLRLAERAYRWLAGRIAARAVATGPRRAPQIGPLRPLAHDAMPKSIVQAASELEAVLDGDCLSVQLDPFVRDLFSRTFLPQSLRTLQDHPTFVAARTRYEPALEKVRSFSWFVSELAPSRKDELLEELLTWGDAAAFTGTSLRHLIVDYPNLTGRAAIALEKAERAAVDASHARHFTAALFLSRAYAEFFMLSLDNDDKATVASRWRPLLERWHRLTPPQKLWMLGFAVTAMVEAAEKGFESDDGETFRLSADTPLGVAAYEVLRWCADEPLDLLANVVSEIAVSLDRLAPEGPTMLRLAPLILFLRTASPVGRLSLTHPRIEPLAILSAFWQSQPLAKLNETVRLTREDDQVESITVWLEDVLVDAVRAAEERRPGMTFSTNAVHFPFSLREGLVIEAEVPTMAVLMRLPEKERPTFARELAQHIGASDGVIYDLLQRVVESPGDAPLLRRLARRAVESPMRQIRLVPALGGFLPDVLLKLRKSSVDGQLRALLSEVSTAGDAVARFDENLPSWVTRDDVHGLIASTARVPGALGWTWAVNCVELEREADIKRAEYFMAHPEVAHFGELWWSIATMWLSAARGTEEQRSTFQQKLEAILASVVSVPSRGEREADCIVALRAVAQNLEPDPSAIVWMTYRLFGWWFLQARNSSESIDDALGDLAATGVGQRSTGADDAADPRTWPAAYDVRLAAVLSAISECSQRVERWMQDKKLPAWKLALSDSAREALARLADRDIEAEVVETPSMVWIPPLRVGMAALGALWMNGGRFVELQQSARERWLSWIPLEEADDMTRPRAFVQQVLWFATKDLDDLTPLEAATLVDRISRSSAASVTTSPIAAVTVARAVGKRLVPVEQAWEYVRRHVGHEGAGKVVAVVFIDSVVNTYPEQTGLYVSETLRAVGRDVVAPQLRDSVAGDAIFDGEEKLRELILAKLP